MIRQWFNRQTVFTMIAIAIVIITIFYSQYLSKKIAKDERVKVETWIEASKSIQFTSDSISLNLAAKISRDNIDIPIIETDEKDNISGNYRNLDSNKVKADKHYLENKLEEFKSQNQPLVLVLSEKPYLANKYYYGESELQKEVRYYPIVQLVIVAMFIITVFVTQRIRTKSTQSQLWAGMAKETAHQLGTPLAGLQGWLEMLKEYEVNEKIIPEIEKDLNRLMLITDRFGKIGSQPNLEEKNIIEQISSMLDYIKKRAGRKVDFELNTNGEESIIAMISPPLFDWVIENLLKNGLDAMEGVGKMTVTIKDAAAAITIDVTDTGKGIAKNNIANVFKPGFTTKKRGWGLGLTLTKRIIEEYHKGRIFVSHSEVGKGTTFRIVLAK